MSLLFHNTIERIGSMILNIDISDVIGGNYMQILYDSKQEFYKKPFGCLRQNQLCEINVKVPRRIAALNVWLCVEEDNGYYKEYSMCWNGMEDGYDCYSLSFSMEQIGLYFYWFKVRVEDAEFLVYKCGSSKTSIHMGEKWQLTCFEQEYDTPKEFKGKVMYQIFPDRFYQVGKPDLKEKLKPFTIHENKAETPYYLPNEQGEVLNNDFYGGTLQGIQEKLPYLRELGVSVLYLNPIFMAFSNHRYDTADYRRIDPMLGTEQDFQTLCRKAHKMGMKIILDGVFSHTGSNSIYFDKENIFGTGAYHHADSPYVSWYDFQQYPERYTSWWGIKTLPCVNELQPDYVEFIIEGEDSVVAHWMRLGADGFRLDVADELPDEFIKKLHDKVKQINPQGLVIGEVWEDASNKESYGVRRKYFANTELDSVMNYPYKDAILRFAAGDSTAKELVDAVMTIAENYPKPVLDCLMNSLSTHDTVRVLNTFGHVGDGLNRDQRAVHVMSPEVYWYAVEREKIAAFLQYLLPGCPCIYYGDEVGMQGFEDPFNRRYFPWDKIDWQLHDYYKNLGHIKKKYRALQEGSVTAKTKGKYVFLLKRIWQQETLYALVNMGQDTFCYPVVEADIIMAHGTTREEDSLQISSRGYVLFTR